MNYWLTKIVFTAVTSIAFLNVNSTYGDDRFSVAIGSKDQLVIFSPSGEKAAEFNPPAIAQTVKVGAASFQVSYGRDVNDLWTVILAPSRTSPSALSFSALDNKIDSDKNGVVTLTFSKDLKKVTVDPGYVGVVKVNDTRLTTAMAVTNAPATKVAPVTTVAPRKEEVAAVPAPAPETVAAPKVDTAAPATTASTTAPAPKLIPLLDTKKPVYWSEPITPPDAKDLPQVASDEIKLVEVKGTVTVTLPNTTQEVPATNGMVIPTGSTVKTGADGSAAAFLGGVNSARLMQETEGSINQSVSSNKRDTVIDLKNGVVFANVGRRAGETQDFKVKTPAGVAAAKGTAFVVKVQGNQLFVAGISGMTSVSDNNGSFIGNATGGTGVPGIVNNQPGSSKANNEAILASLLVVVNAFNDKINALEAKDPSTLTPTEKAYLDQAPKIAEKVADMLNDSLKKEGFKGDIPPAVQQLIDKGEISTTPDLSDAHGDNNNPEGGPQTPTNDPPAGPGFNFNPGSDIPKTTATGGGTGN